jgi:recombinational DNA repair protein (RecF pathway)
MGEQHVRLTIDENNLVTEINPAYTTIKDAEQFDNCVLCGNQTQYKTTTHIDMRYGYVEGVGQLCGHCYSKGSPSSREMMMIPKNLVEQHSNNMELGAAVRKFYWENYK